MNSKANSVVPIAVAVIVALGAPSCGGGGFGPGVELTSPHFAYFAESGAAYPNQILSILEANRADFSTILPLPDQVTEYHLVASEDTASKHCGNTPSQPDCALGDEVVSVDSIHFHELIHAYTFARFGHFPSPILTEGIATLVNCVGDDLGAMNVFPEFQQDLDWRTVASVSQVGHFEPYVFGRRFVKFLVQAFGWAKFWEYYDTDSYTLNPDEFGKTFQKVFGQSLDAVWASMQQALPILSPTLCPCSSPSVNADGTLRVLDPWSAGGGDTPFLYDTLPSGGGGSYRIGFAPTFGGHLNACDGLGNVQLGTPNPSVTLFRADAPWVVSVDEAYAARSGRWITDSCADAEEIDVGGLTNLEIYDSRRKGGTSSVFVRMASAVPRSLKITYLKGQACDTCEAGDTSCVDLPATVPWTGTKIFRFELPADSPFYLDFSGQ